MASVRKVPRVRSSVNVAPHRAHFETLPNDWSCSQNEQNSFIWQVRERLFVVLLGVGCRLSYTERRSFGRASRNCVGERPTIRLNSRLKFVMD